MILGSMALCCVLTFAVLSLPTRWSRVWRPLVVGGGATVLTLILADAGARFLRLSVGLPRLRVIPSAEYHHLHPPHAEMFAGFYDGAAVTARTNGDGFRTRYSRESYRDHDVRIAVVGDSFAFGLGVEEQASLAPQMERLLRGHLRHASVAVLNAGVVSYSPFLENLLLRGVIPSYRPQLVVQILDASDIGDDHHYATEWNGNEPLFARTPPPPPRYYGPLIEMSRLVLEPLSDSALHPLRGMRRRLLGKPASPPSTRHYEFEVSIGEVREDNRFFIYRHPLEDTRAYFEATLENIIEAARAASAMDARFLLVVTPRYHHWNPRECPQNWESDQYELDEPHQYEFFRFFREAGDRVHFPILDLLPAFRQTTTFPLVFRDDPHWNAAGHLLVAERLVEYLLRRELLP